MVARRTKKRGTRLENPRSLIRKSIYPNPGDHAEIAGMKLSRAGTHKISVVQHAETVVGSPKQVVDVESIFMIWKMIMVDWIDG